MQIVKGYVKTLLLASVHLFQPHVGNQQSTQEQECVDSHDTADDYH